MAMLAEHWRRGASWLGWNFLGMLGLWGAGSLVFFFLEDPPWLQLIDRGQFFLYSVGVLGQIMYILTKERKITTLPYRSVLTFGSVGFLLMCTLLFSGTVLSNFTDSPDIVPKMWFLRPLGIITFVGSLSMGALVTIAAEGRDEVDIDELSRRNIGRLEDRVSGI